jgi:hypothetical protein
MHTLKQDTAETDAQSRRRFWLLVPIMAVALVLVWVIGAQSAPVDPSTASVELGTAPLLFLSPPDPFQSPLFLPLIARRTNAQLRLVYLPVVLRQ